MRIKTDYMGNDQLLPAYNVQIGVADEYIAVVDVNHYRSDMDCFIPLMEHFKQTYGFYPKYPVADAGYGSYNNYIFCNLHIHTVLPCVRIDFLSHFFCIKDEMLYR